MLGTIIVGFCTCLAIAGALTLLGGGMNWLMGRFSGDNTWAETFPAPLSGAITVVLLSGAVMMFYAVGGLMQETFLKPPPAQEAGVTP